MERLIDAVIVEDAVVSPQIIVAEADRVIVPAHDGEFHLRVCHGVARLGGEAFSDCPFSGGGRLSRTSGEFRRVLVKNQAGTIPFGVLSGEFQAPESVLQLPLIYCKRRFARAVRKGLHKDCQFA